MEKGKTGYLLLSRKERWGLTAWGWVLLLILILLPSFLFFRNLYSVLSPVKRENTKVLALEGFISDYLLKDAIREFKQGNYSLLVTTGTPIEAGGLLSEYKSTARVAAESLKRLGFDSTRLVVVETDEIMYDRTYNSGLEFKHWLRRNMPDVTAINLITMSVHGARSKVLFQAALGDSIKVGIISLPNMFYGPDDWWHSSKGFREVMNEALGYYYVKLFFRPYEKEMKKKIKDS